MVTTRFHCDRFACTAQNVLDSSFGALVGLVAVSSRKGITKETKSTFATTLRP